jgi:hypothetical protein
MERKKQESEKPDSTQIPAFDRESAVTDNKKDKRPEVFQPVKSIQQAGTINFSVSQKTLKMPILLLLSSIIALVLSIFLFCQRSGSSDLISCLMELIGF